MTSRQPWFVGLMLALAVGLLAPLAAQTPAPAPPPTPPQAPTKPTEVRVYCTRLSGHKVGVKRPA